MDETTSSNDEAARVTCAVSNERCDLVMSTAAFARFTDGLDASPEVVPEMVQMFRLPRIPKEASTMPEEGLEPPTRGL